MCLWIGAVGGFWVKDAGLVSEVEKARLVCENLVSEEVALAVDLMVAAVLVAMVRVVVEPSRPRPGPNEVEI